MIFLRETRVSDLQFIFLARGELEMVVTLGMAVPTAAVELHIIFIYILTRKRPPGNPLEAGYRGGRTSEAILLVYLIDY